MNNVIEIDGQKAGARLDLPKAGAHDADVLKEAERA